MNLSKILSPRFGGVLNKKAFEDIFGGDFENEGAK